VIQAVQLEIEMRDVHIEPAIAIHLGRIDAHARFVPSVLTRRQAGNQ